MTKKIGVITINDFNNYGNRLQCYAVQYYLENMGYVVENIYNTYDRSGPVVSRAKALARRLREFRNKEMIDGRKQNFQKFNESIRFSTETIINGRFNKYLNEKYDYFISGSDQVWNLCDSGRSEIDFLSFSAPEKKIAFSASIGVEKIPDYLLQTYRQYLKNYKSISVREESARGIVEELTGRNDIEVLVDPTMLLTMEEWEAVAQKPAIKYPANYILTYFLGGAGKWEENIKDFATKHGCAVIDIYNKHTAFYTCGPQHFLDLEKNAFLICTDSFHAAAFAFLFNRPFAVFDRENAKMDMDSRVKTFLSKFGLEQNRYHAGRKLEEYLTWDYTKGYETLKNEREKARAFLQKALS